MVKLHIALAANSGYIVPATVLLQSLFEHHREVEVNVYLLHLEGSMERRDLDFLARFTEQHGGKLVPLEVKTDMLAAFPDTRHGKAALLRLCLPALLPEVDKILYLDGDIVVQDSLVGLFSIDLGTHYVAAGKDTCPVYHPERMSLLGIRQGHWYFNSGVALMNLRELRRIDLPKAVSDYAAKYFDVIESPDQDALNYICQGRTVYLHPRYNMNYAVERDVAAAVWGAEEVAQARRVPAIIHYIGPVKPWSVFCTHPRRREWWRILRRTPLAGFRPKDDSLRNRLLAARLLAARAVESRFTLAGKRRLGRLMPEALKAAVKKKLLKKK